MTPEDWAVFRRDVQRIYFEPLDDLARRVGVMGPTERKRWQDLAREYRLRLVYRTRFWSQIAISRPTFRIDVT